MPIGLGDMSLALNNMLVSFLMVFVAALAAYLVYRLFRRRIVAFFSSFLGVLLALGYVADEMDIASKLAPCFEYIRPHLTVISIIASSVFWGLVLFSLLGGKLPRK